MYPTTNRATIPPAVKFSSSSIRTVVTCLLLATFLPKSDCFSGPLPNGKREFRGQVSYPIIVCWIEVCHYHLFLEKKFLKQTS